jgi:transposase-like protein
VPKEYPENLMEFERRFRTEQACQDYLASLRWPKGFFCPRCKHAHGWVNDRGLRRCGNCRRDVSPTAGTIFHKSHIPLRVWFRAIWWITNQKSGISALGLQRALGLGSYRTAWACLHKLRRAMVRPGREPLNGKIEVDEVAVGGQERGDRGKGWRSGETKALVVVAAEARGDGIGRIRLKQIPDSSGDSLGGFVKSVAAPGSEIITDGWKGYSGLAEMGYAHRPTPLRGKGRQAANAVLPRVNRIASLLKRWILGIHHGNVSKKHLGYYLDEYTFRFNRRQSVQRGMLFYRLIQQAVAINPVPYTELIK